MLGETLLMDVKSLAYFGLDELGTKIWTALETCTHTQEVFDGLIEVDDLDEEVLARKFQGILQGLEMSNIISLEPLEPGAP